MSLWPRIASYLRVTHLRRGLLLALFGGIAAYVGLGHMDEAQTHFDTARSARVAEVSAQAAYEARAALSDRYLDLRARVDALETRFAADVDRSTLVERMATLSAAAGTRIVHGSNSFGQDRVGVTPLLQDLTVEGSYAQVRDFLGSVRQLETLTFLISISLTANPDGTLVRGKMRFMTLAGASG